VRVPGFIRRNWKLKVLCFFIAFVTWVGVVYAGNPPETKVIALPVPQSPANIPASFVLVHRVNPVLVRVGGDQNTLDALNPQVLTMGVDWSAVNRAGTYSIPISITSSDPSIELIDPATSVQVDLDSFTSKSVPVTIQITSPPPVGYQSGTQQATPSTVVVDGPEHELVGIVAKVAVNLSTQKANFEEQIPVLVYTAAGVRLNNVSVDHTDVSVSIAITADFTTKEVAIIARTEGNPSPGHYLTGIIVTPLTVIATGPRDLLNSIDFVYTTPVVLAGGFGNFMVTATVEAPAGVTLSTTKVTVEIETGTVPTPPPSPTPSPSPSPTGT
jgi:YbbR domain-containing protein